MDMNELSWMDGYGQLREEYGKNIPEPVLHFPVAWAGKAGPGFVVVDDFVYSLTPVPHEMDGDTLRLLYLDNEELHDDLHSLDAIDVCRKWGIRLDGID